MAKKKDASKQIPGREKSEMDTLNHSHQKGKKQMDALRKRKDEEGDRECLSFTE